MCRCPFSSLSSRPCQVPCLLDSTAFRRRCPMQAIRRRVASHELFSRRWIPCLRGTAGRPTQSCNRACFLLSSLLIPELLVRAAPLALVAEPPFRQPFIIVVRRLAARGFEIRASPNCESRSSPTVVMHSSSYSHSWMGICFERLAWRGTAWKRLHYRNLQQVVDGVVLQGIVIVQEILHR